MKLFSLSRLVRKLAVITLAFWLAGAGCLLGCEGMAVAAPAEQLNLTSRPNQGSTLVVEGDACASTEGHSCCKKKSHSAKRVPAAAVEQANTRAANDSPVRTLNESSTSGMRACPFAISRALSVAKLRDGQSSGRKQLHVGTVYRDCV